MRDLWVPISGAIAQQRKVETIANNIANANTPGFKKDSLAFKEHLTALSEKNDDINLPTKDWAPEDFYKTQSAEHGFVKIDGSFTDFKQGRLLPTGNPFDIAIRGNGFFEVLTPNGVRFTRKGIFSLNNNGELVTEHGFFVLSEIDKSQFTNPEAKLPSPESRKIVLNNLSKPSLNTQGQIFQDNQPIANLSINEFKDIHALRKEGNSLYENIDNDNFINSKSSSTYQGFIEESNVNAVTEMSELIKAHRHFESIQKVIKTYDQMAGKSANDMAKF